MFVTGTEYFSGDDTQHSVEWPDELTSAAEREAQADHDTDSLVATINSLGGRCLRNSPRAEAMEASVRQAGQVLCEDRSAISKHSLAWRPIDRGKTC